MLAIRMQRTGRKGHAMFRVIVQDSRLSPTSGKVVELLGNYDPHTKAVTLDKEKAATFLNNGAQPSPRVVVLLKSEGIKLPDWVKEAPKKESKIRNAEKLRRNQPKEEPVAEPEDTTEDTPVEATASEAETVEDVATEAEEAKE